ncbi:MAG TPA: HlyD family efflux transporter periplasmic adaptor subunit [Hyphomicrobiaceae bacterium]|nr:HlyD family efflux transporter periplasmic adaptor subunit [Hyphomicrobiaceae bacterium]
MFQRIRKRTGRTRSLQDQPGSEGSTAATTRGAGKSRDIRGLSDALARAFDAKDETTKQQKPNVGAANATTIRRAVKIGIAAGLAFSLGWKPLLATLTTTSAEAFVNTRLVTLRAPIDGRIDGFSADTRLGVMIDSGEALFHITEPLTDRAREMDVERLLNRARHERDVLVRRIMALGVVKADLEQQANAFGTNRKRQLKERIGELEEKISAAVAVQKEATIGVDRNTRLDSLGLARNGALARAIRDEAVSTRLIAELKHQVAALHVELNALNNNQFVGDSYNDRPQSAQRAEQLGQEITELSIEREAKAEEIVELTAQLTAEKERLDQLSSVWVKAPNNGLVWELLTSPGERVTRGQDLMRVLDCSQTVVSAAVEEGVYNRIRVGDAITFRLRGESNDRPGTIVRLSGHAAAQANLAISPNVLLKAPYRVAISVPSLGHDGICGVGRTGKVTFDSPLADVAAASKKQ